MSEVLKRLGFNGGQRSWYKCQRGTLNPRLSTLGPVLNIRRRLCQELAIQQVKDGQHLFRMS